MQDLYFDDVSPLLLLMFFGLVVSEDDFVLGQSLRYVGALYPCGRGLSFSCLLFLFLSVLSSVVRSWRMVFMLA